MRAAQTVLVSKTQTKKLFFVLSVGCCHIFLCGSSCVDTMCCWMNRIVFFYLQLSTLLLISQRRNVNTYVFQGCLLSFKFYHLLLYSFTLKHNFSKTTDLSKLSLISIDLLCLVCRGISGAVAACQCGMLLSRWLLCVLYRTFQVSVTGHRPDCSRTRFLCYQERLYRQQVCSHCLSKV